MMFFYRVITGEWRETISQAHKQFGFNCNSGVCRRKKGEERFYFVDDQRTLALSMV